MATAALRYICYRHIRYRWRPLHTLQVATAALNSAETIHKDGSDVGMSDLGSLTKLTNDVLKQAEASLAAFIGAVEVSAAARCRDADGGGWRASLA